MDGSHLSRSECAGSVLRRSDRSKQVVVSTRAISRERQIRLLSWTVLPKTIRLTPLKTSSNDGDCFVQSSAPLLPDGISPRLASGLVAWFGASTFGVATLIILGGVTRLTRSGLSMTDWKFTGWATDVWPHLSIDRRPNGTGERPPLTASDWETEFEKYRQSPEFHKVNRSISLEEFKFIYWMEYAHRMWGRCLGAIFGTFRARDVAELPSRATRTLLRGEESHHSCTGATHRPAAPDGRRTGPRGLVDGEEWTGRAAERNGCSSSEPLPSGGASHIRLRDLLLSPVDDALLAHSPSSPPICLSRHPTRYGIGGRSLLSARRVQRADH